MAAEDGLSFSDPRDEVRAKTVERLRGHIELAAKLGSAITVGTLSGKLDNCQSNEYQRRRSQALESLAAVCEIAQRAGIIVLLEPLNRYEIRFYAKAAAPSGFRTRFLGTGGSPNGGPGTDYF